MVNESDDDEPISAPHRIEPFSDGDDLDDDDTQTTYKGLPSPSTVPEMAPEIRRTAIANAIKDVPDLQTITESARQSFLDSLPDRTNLLLTQTFGKPLDPETPVPTFLGQSKLRHILFPLLRSNFLDDPSVLQFSMSHPSCRQAKQLIDDYGNVDFRPLRTLWNDDSWKTMETYDHARIAMMTACAIHYDGDIPSVVRYIGGPFTDQHRDTTGILARCKPILDSTDYNDLERLFRVGVPAKCNAYSSDENFREYQRYGNHKTVLTDLAITRKGIMKDFRPGFLLSMDPRIRWHLPNLHICPISMQNVGHRRRSARAAYDGSFHPTPNSHTINDWTSKFDEPAMTFQKTWERYLGWNWRVRGTYPTEEIYPQDDDAVMAHRRLNYHPNMVSMHGFYFDDIFHMYDRLSYGDTTSCPSYDVVSRCRSTMAQHLWEQPDIVDRARPYLPRITIAENTTPPHERRFAQANLDSKNPSVIRPDGSRCPPPFDQYVDDCLYGDIYSLVERGLAASKLGLYGILGIPDPDPPIVNQPDNFSDEKLDPIFTHLRRVLGKLLDTRRMMVSLPADRRDDLTALLDEWSAKPHFTLMEATVLYGSLQSACETCHWGKPYLYTIQNLLRSIILKSYTIMKAIQRRKKITVKIQRELAPSLIHRLEPLVSKDIASAIFRSKQRQCNTPRLQHEAKALADYLRDPTNPWEVPIGHCIPRDPFVHTAGDASEEGLAFHCAELKIYGVILLSDATHRRCFLSKGHPNKIHINQLELIAVILQLAAAITLSRDPTLHQCPDVRTRLANAPPCPIWATACDNQSARSWAAKQTAKSERGQSLLRLYCSLCRDTDIKFEPYWISSKDNWFADALSRPPLPTAQTRQSLTAFSSQIFRSTPLNASWMIFQPSPELFSMIQSSLSSNDKAILPSPPEQYGHFETAASTASCYLKL
jgi:hypothetical protein